MSGVNGGFGFSVIGGSDDASVADYGGFGGTPFGEISSTPTITTDISNLCGGSSFIQPLESIEMSGYSNGDATYQFDLGTMENGNIGGDGFGGSVLGPAEGVLQGQVAGLEGKEQSFEKSLITLNDISNYRASGLDWMETGVSNWLSFEQGAKFGISEMTAPSTTPSVSTSSMYNFYDEEEDECQKDLELDAYMETNNEEDLKGQWGNSAAIGGGLEATTGNGEVGSILESEEEEDDDDDDDEEDDEENNNSDESEGGNEKSASLKVNKPAVRPNIETSCTICTDKLPSRVKFEKHMKDVHQVDRPYKCPICDKTFAKWYQRDSHKEVHNPDRYKAEPQWECVKCDKKYHIRTTLYTHYRSVHPGEKPPKQPVTRKKKLEQQTPGGDIMKTLKKLNKLKQRRKLQTKSANKTNPEAYKPTIPPQKLPPPEIPPVQTIDDSRSGHYPCRVCGKVFSIPFNLQNHMTMHTGEKPYKCPYCEDTFRLKQTLNYHLQRRHRTKEDTRNILKLHKCRICGRDDFYMFHELHSHRTRKHKDVTYDKEKEKTFGCGICLKPYFLREDAIVCALLAHDPTGLKETMFKYKCPACPQERLGYFKLALLRKHWDDEHSEKELPGNLRKASNFDEITINSDTLPTVRVNKYKAQDIRENGLPRNISFECPLYFDLTKFGPSPEEEHWMASLMLDILSDIRADGPQICTICGEELSKKGNLKRHLTTVHISSEMLEQEAAEKEMEEDEGTERVKERRPRPEMIAAEVENIFNTVIGKTKVVEEEESDEEEETEEENGQELTFQCKFCDKTFPKKRALLFHEVRGHINPIKKEPAENTQATSKKSRLPVKNTRAPVRSSRVPVKRTRAPLIVTRRRSNTQTRAPIRPRRIRLLTMTDSEDSSSAEEQEMGTTADIKSEDVKEVAKVSNTVNVQDTKAVNAFLKFRSVTIVLSRVVVEKKSPSSIDQAPVSDLEDENYGEMEESPESLQEELQEFPCESQQYENELEVKTDLMNDADADPLLTNGTRDKEGDHGRFKTPYPPIITRRKSNMEQRHQNIVIKQTPKIVLRRVALNDGVKVSPGDSQCEPQQNGIL